MSGMVCLYTMFLHPLALNKAFDQAKRFKLPQSHVVVEVATLTNDHIALALSKPMNDRVTLRSPFPSETVVARTPYKIHTWYYRRSYDS